MARRNLAEVLTGLAVLIVAAGFLGMPSPIPGGPA